MRFAAHSRGIVDFSQAVVEIYSVTRTVTYIAVHIGVHVVYCILGLTHGLRNGDKLGWRLVVHQLTLLGKSTSEETPSLRKRLKYCFSALRGLALHMARFLHVVFEHTDDEPHAVNFEGYSGSITS
jgi:hypothetical protein